MNILKNLSSKKDKDLFFERASNEQPEEPDNPDMLIHNNEEKKDSINKRKSWLDWEIITMKILTKGLVTKRGNTQRRIGGIWTEILCPMMMEMAILMPNMTNIIFNLYIIFL